MNGRSYLIFLVIAVVLVGGLFGYLRQTLRGPAVVHIGGDVAAPYDFPAEHGDIAPITAEATLRNATTRYEGYPLAAIISRAKPHPDAAQILLRATDGYAFFFSMDELHQNESILLAPQGQGDEAAYDVVGPASSKAWVRSIGEVIIIGQTTLSIDGELGNPDDFNPADWVSGMDSVTLDVGNGPQKLQGVPLGQVLAAAAPESAAQTVVLYGTDGDTTNLPLPDLLADDAIRLFTVIEADEMWFAIATMDGELILAPVSRISVQ